MTQENLLVIPGNNDESTGSKVVIDSDTTVADLLAAAHLNANNYMLQVEKGGRKISLQSQDRLADHVQAGEKVFAVPSHMVVGLAL